MAQNITLSWTKTELVQYISNHSAFVAQSLSLSGDVAFDYNTLTEDNEEAYLNDKISEAINALVPHFARIIEDDAEILEDENYGLVFTPRIEGGAYSKAELSHIKTLCRKFIASYILADWYSMKGIVAMNNYFATQSAQSGAELNITLDRFVRPVRKVSVNVGRVSYSKSNVNYTHVNNRSDFAMVWGTSDGAPLPNGEYDVDFYTDGEVVRSFNSLDTQLVKPIEGKNDKVRLIFDFADGKYFANGVLKYTIYGAIQDADFPDRERRFEQSGETTIEIWDGASDADAQMSAAFIPSYMKLQFSDLTEQDIEALQKPLMDATEGVIEATDKANTAASTALSMANYAKEQGDYAKEQAGEAYSQSVNANSAARQARDEANLAKDKGDIAEQQGKSAEGKGLIAEQKGNIAEEKGNKAETKGDIAEQQGISAAEAAAAANKAIEDFTDWIGSIEKKESSRQEQEAIRESSERARIQLENNRIEFERLRGEAESDRQEAESERNAAEMQRAEVFAEKVGEIENAISSANGVVEDVTNAAEGANAAAAQAREAVERIPDTFLFTQEVDGKEYDDLF